MKPLFELLLGAGVFGGIILGLSSIMALGLGKDDPIKSAVIISWFIFVFIGIVGVIGLSFI